jgi:hypothetical protein
MCTARGMSAFQFGVVDFGLGVNSGYPGEQVIVCDSQFTLTIDQLREVNEATLPALFGGEECSAQVSESYWDQ